MYLIVVYDIEIDRVNKVHKFLRKYLFWRQNSVFEGEVSKAQIEQIKVGLNEIIKKEKDSVLLYILDNKSNFQFKVLGIEKNLMSTIL
ncbi:MAG: CRISPR-associated endoribonuclease Cas2 [Euryarchaeota archaeon ADurb.Bin023]|mgnify:CR=1 FL=1|jgi:CRISPR-associated protein Cas2|uniref:CRISPR-associated endoribonuclease Cas2 n=1 Tax=Candidatus Methanofastidiosum methylothiophilum TaxID=1705564 RepID=A0A150JBT4_9EURY|nr:MAG: CRISPR-associated endoribonuclease Cas2 [Candidatus Methanofastidiosum methylthiophilus]MBP6932046.1 CRISPR-associated endonuclease Cas2 [Methanofastidiosum sp.]OQC51056.1 MAG: CRISPR-associated endoribonuclease Cas2 [Euryarchaeota archaeon ADurb.Bin023]HNZ60262.1 CRISPR-associated endonuclease Cas2 [Methanofastidiosum sp.]HOE93494.1 CRISPR-associated endonuclease Cas2 [Methanofastidiosum sp.]